MDKVTGIPFPYDEATMPATSDMYDGTWIGGPYNSYKAKGIPGKIKQLLDIAINFKNTRYVPLFCGDSGYTG